MFFPTNPDLADILGDMDFDFENFDFFLILLDPKFPDFQVSDFQKSGLGQPWAGLERKRGRGHVPAVLVAASLVDDMSKQTGTNFLKMVCKRIF